MKESEITFKFQKIEPSELFKESKNLFNDELEEKCYFYKMVLKDKTGIIYEKFKKPFEKNEEQNFSNIYLDELFLNYKKFINFLEKIKNIFIQKIRDFNLYNLNLLIILKIQEIGPKNENIKILIVNIYFINQK